MKTWIADRVDWIDNNLDAIAPKPVTLTYMVDGEVYKKVTTTSTRKRYSERTNKRGIYFTGWYYDKDGFQCQTAKGETSLQRDTT